jgi:hypothetical protein
VSWPAADDSEEEEEPGTSGRERGEMDAGRPPRPLHPSLVTLALLPRSQWQGLVHLDAIKVVQPPKEASTPPVLGKLLTTRYIAMTATERVTVFRSDGHPARDV